MADALQVTVSGLAQGVLYALMLLGILLIYHVSNVVNFAQGSFAMLGGLGSLYLLLSFGVPLVVGIPIAIGGVALLAAATERWLIRRLPTTLDGTDMVLTLGLFLLITSVAQTLLQQGAPRRYPELLTWDLTFLGAFVDGNIIAALIFGIAVFAVTALIFTRTRAGLVLRASADDPESAQTLGWNVFHVRTGTWAIAGALAAAAGIFIATRIPVESLYTNDLMIKAFIAGILGGLHRWTAPLVIAILLGVFESWVGFVLGANWRIPGVFGLVLIVLLLAPTRYLRATTEARA